MFYYLIGNVQRLYLFLYSNNGVIETIDEPFIQCKGYSYWYTKFNQAVIAHQEESSLQCRVTTLDSLRQKLTSM